MRASAVAHTSFGGQGGPECAEFFDTPPIVSLEKTLDDFFAWHFLEIIFIFSCQNF
jgi:hypothetical protein